MPTISLDKLAIEDLPVAENDSYEYKSSDTELNGLKIDIKRAASAFSNSGGGCLIAGVDDKGKPDGGFLEHVKGRQSIRDWADQVIASVSPVVTRYEIRIFETVAVGRLDAGKVIMAISFPESHNAPHMADDNRYYIRAGAHSVSASAFIVESLLMRRSVSRPILTHVIRERPGTQEVVQMGVIALNSAAAVDVEINVSPLSGLLKGHENYFPIRLPVVDQNTPFFFDCTYFSRMDHDLHDSTVISVRYRDLAGNSYEHKSHQPLRNSLGPIKFVVNEQGAVTNKI